MDLKKLLFTGLTLLWLLFCGCRQTESEVSLPAQTVVSASVISNFQHQKKDEPDTVAVIVYVCKSSGATRYHYDRSCGALKRCKHAIEKAEKAKAEAAGLTCCGFKTCRK